MFLLVIFSNLLAPTTANAEIVTTSDGRQILLNNDGSYEFISKEGQDWREYIEVLDPKLKLTYESIDQRSVRFMPRFKNLKPTSILGIRFNSKFKNSFGDLIFEFSNIHEYRLDYKASTQTQMSFSFEEKLDRVDEPFEKLFPLVEFGTGSVETSIISISFSDGRIIEFKEF